MTKLAPPQPNLDWMDAPIESEKWRNMPFDKNGNSYYGHIIYDSEFTAKSIADKIKTSTRDIYVVDGPKIHINGITYLDREDYSHTIQIPVKG